MTRFRPLLFGLLTASLLLVAAPTPSLGQNPDSLELPAFSPTLIPLPVDTSQRADVPFVRSPKKVVVRMLEFADVSADDVVYDLGSGDGRIPITAAQQFGARGVGIEIRPDLVEKARTRATAMGVANKVEFRQGDLFEADFSDATVVTLYLLPDVNTKLRPTLFEQLDPGTRVISHGFDMDAWEPDSTIEVDDSQIYRWTIPEEVPSHLQE
jgi:protein-L-isoaspartate O-methyltransferase